LPDCIIIGTAPFPTPSLNATVQPYKMYLTEPERLDLPVYTYAGYTIDGMDYHGIGIKTNLLDLDVPETTPLIQERTTVPMTSKYVQT